MLYTNVPYALCYALCSPYTNVTDVLYVVPYLVRLTYVGEPNG